MPQAVDGGDEEAVLTRIEGVESGLDRGLDVARGRLAIEGEDLQFGQVVDLAHLPAVEIVAQRLGVREFRAHHEPAPAVFPIESRQGVRRRRAQQSTDCQILYVAYENH